MPWTWGWQDNFLSCWSIKPNLLWFNSSAFLVDHLLPRKTQLFFFFSNSHERVRASCRQHLSFVTIIYQAVDKKRYLSPTVKGVILKVGFKLWLSSATWGIITIHHNILHSCRPAIYKVLWTFLSYRGVRKGHSNSPGWHPTSYCPWVLRATFQQLKEKKLWNPHEGQVLICTNHTGFLRYTFLDGVFSPDPKKVQTIHGAAAPTNASLVCSRLDMTYYSVHFIKNLAHCWGSLQKHCLLDLDWRAPEVS